jgi:hypothetical protein
VVFKWEDDVRRNGVSAFTRDGIDNLRQIIADKRPAGTAPPQVSNK